MTATVHPSTVYLARALARKERTTRDAKTPLDPPILLARPDELRG